MKRFIQLVAKSTAILILLALNRNYCSGQINVLYTVNNPVEVSIADLYRFQISNSYSNSLKADFSFLLTAGGQTVYQAECKQTELTSGIFTTDFNSLNPTNERFNADIRFEFISRKRILPAGHYQWCIRLTDPVKKEEIVNSCFEVTVEPVTPPILIFPDNRSTISTLTPTLTWLPPAPVPDGFKYELTLTEILGKQSPADAIRKNFVLVKAEGISETIFPYPINSTPLEFGKTYAWQVKALNSTGAIFYTEIWTFTPAKDTISENVVFYENYIIPRSTKDGNTVNLKGEIRMDLSGLPHSGLTYKIYDTGNNLIIDNEQGLVKAMTGGRFIIDPASSGKLKNKGHYLLKIEGDKGNSGYIQFRYYRN